MIIHINEDESYENELMEDEIFVDDAVTDQEPVVMDEIIRSKTMDYGLLNNNTSSDLFHIVDGIKQNKNIISNVSNNQLDNIQGNF